jgi:hypothetical protein
MCSSRGGVESAPLKSVEPPLELTAEPVESIQAVVERQRARADRLLALSLEERSALITGVSNDNGGNGSDDTGG